MTSGPIRLPAPPPLRTRDGAGSALLMALPALGGVGSVALVATGGMGASGTMRTRSLLAAGLFLVVTIAFVLVQVDRQRRQRDVQDGESREDYLDHLADARASVLAAGRDQQVEAWHRFPPPDALPVLASHIRTPRAGPLVVRVGIGRGLRTDPPEPSEPRPGQPADPVAQAAMERLVAHARHLEGLPVTLDLTTVPVLAPRGDRTRREALARAAICSAVHGRTPDQVRVAVLASAERAPAWDWLKWLPHHGSAGDRDAIGPSRLVASDADSLGRLVRGHPGHLLLVADLDSPADHRAADDLARTTGAGTVLDLGDTAPPGATVVRLSDDGATLLGPTGESRDLRADACDLPTALAFARRVAARQGGPSGAAGLDLPALLRLDAPTHAPLRVPIGVADDGAPLLLDLREAAAGGIGPHGLVVGATGSGKSELLRTLVTALALTHPPEELNLVLVDFKGGATFAGLSALPHTAAMITNLADDLTLVDRMHDALAGELVRRQEVLRAAGDLASVTDLDAAVRAGSATDRLPALVLVIDEFSELLVARPELLALFTAIGRLGRSLGVHLLLASQRLDEGRLRGLEAHLGYRIALRTFSASESRAVLGVPDAHELPRAPGVGYLSSGPGHLVRFRAAHVSTLAAAPGPPADQVIAFTAAPSEAPMHVAITGQSVLEQAVAAVRARAGEDRRAHPIWLPPLTGTAPLPRLLGELVADPTLGLLSPAWRSADSFAFPVGVIDRPREQRYDPLVVRLDGPGGHVGVVGAPRSGKSTLLRTVALSLAVTATPIEANLYLLDLDGGLAEVAGLPHVAAIAGRADPDRVRRVVAAVCALAEERAAGAASGDRPRVALVVDGWGTLRERFPDLEGQLVAMAQGSLAHGVHVVLSATRWADVRPSLRDVLGTRLELRLGDPLESEADRAQARLVPRQPGRGITADGLHFLVATADLPGIGLASRIRACWPGAFAPTLPELPGRVDLAQLRSSAGPATGEDTGVPRIASTGSGTRGLLLGVDDRLRPISLSEAPGSHLLVFGDEGSGRTNLLRVVAAEVARTRAPEAARIIAVDPRRTLIGDLPPRHTLDHLSTPDEVAGAIRDLATQLAARRGPDRQPARQPGSDPGGTTPARADVWVLVDDHELVAPAALDPLLALLPHAPDIGLHLVLARRASGAARSLHDPVVRSLRELGAQVLLLDGPDDEGPIAGRHRFTAQPPGRGLLVARRDARLVQLAWVGRVGRQARS